MSVREEDILYEEECLRNQYSVKTWLRYLEHKKSDTTQTRIEILQRAVQALPGSYKLYKMLLELRMSVLLIGKEDENGMKELNPEYPLDHILWQQTNYCFEKSLILMHKFPLIWELFVVFLMHQTNRITYTRRTFDRAIKSLPVTQHDRIWKRYLKFASLAGGETCSRIWRRYLKIQPTMADVYVETLLKLDPPKKAEAACVLATIIENPKKYGSSTRTIYQYWSQLCDIVCEYPDPIHVPQQDHLMPGGDSNLIALRRDHLDVEKILRTGIHRFTDQVGKLWNSLARWFVIRGDLERARDIYEEALGQVKTVRDFTLVFDSFAKMEEEILNAMMQEEDVDSEDLDFRLARFERLLQHRPILLNDVLIRQNPHLVSEWMNRAKLFGELGSPESVVKAYEEAIASIPPKKADGHLHQLWIGYAKFFEEKEMIERARQVFERATQVPFKKIQDLVQIWTAWVEMELRLENYEEALQVIGRGTSPVKRDLRISYNDESRPPQERVFKSTKLWSLYVDLEESIGSIESTKACYDRILELKIATPQIIINFATFLEEHSYFEESFRAYEKGIELFKYPIAFEIWNLYLTKFIKRYQGTKIERTRDLFEHAVEGCPPKFAKPIHLLYAKYEEDYGLARNALRIYDRATKKVEPEDLLDLYRIYIAKASAFFGLVSTREIYQKALETLPDKFARDIALQFAQMEVKLGEVDRSRAVYAYASQFSNPRLDNKYWEEWHNFEVKYGNEDTYKEMLRIKRSVQAKYNTDAQLLQQQILQARQLDLAENTDSGTRVAGFVAAEKTAKNDQPLNPDQIEIEMSEEEEEEETEVVEQSVPSAVFGKLAQETENVGAKDRFKRKRAE
ncbi:hypothetical protein EDD86DRAFT_197777 [Gorgonomyces haynaldii]|nr:hypothetical protein EDD86DRAFT_197777 [Gorgonomyces haynaldii]